MNNQTTIGILGSGTWGIALARLLHRNGHDVTVWSKFPKEIENLSATRTHPALPGLVIPETVHFTCDLQTVASGKDILLFAVPSIAIRQTAESARPFIPDGQIIVDVAKGIEPDTLMTMTEVIRDELSKDGQHDHVKLVALSGPTHAEEVALDMPTSIVSACTDMQVAENASVISVMLSISNEPGSLSRILNKFFLYGLDMTKIESRPIRDGSFDVVFHIDFKGNLRDRSIAAFLNDLCKSCRDFKLLGNAVVMV